MGPHLSWEARAMGHPVSTVLLLTAILVLEPACGRDTRSPADRQLSARTEAAFGISLPCSLRWCGSYLDGGSVGGVLVDAKGDSLQWAWYSGARTMPPMPESIRHDRMRSEAWVDSIMNSVPLLAYVGAKHFRATGARPLAVGSARESLFIHLLWNAIGADSVFKDSVQSHEKRPRAANVARMLQRQRAGEPVFP